MRITTVGPNQKNFAEVLNKTAIVLLYPSNQGGQREGAGRTAIEIRRPDFFRAGVEIAKNHPDGKWGYAELVDYFQVSRGTIRNRLKRAKLTLELLRSKAHGW